jgi:hypothetical protein
MRTPAVNHQNGVMDQATEDISTEDNPGPAQN